MHTTCKCMHNLCQTRRWTKDNVGGLYLLACWCVRVLLQISAPFTPLSTFRFQPLPAVATHDIDVDITFHYVTSQFSAFGRLGVAWRCSALTADANLDVDNHNMQQQLQQVQMVLGAGGSRWLRVVAAVCDRCGWTKPPHHMPPRSQSARPLSTPKTKTSKLQPESSLAFSRRFAGVLQALSMLANLDVHRFQRWSQALQRWQS